MAIILTQQRKRQRYLIILTVIVITALILIWWNYLIKSKEKKSAVPLNIYVPKEIKINFNIFNNPLLSELQLFEEIPPFEQNVVTPVEEGIENVGRENPFLPYYPTPTPLPTSSPTKK